MDKAKLSPDSAAERRRGKYVMSCNPSPAVFAGDSFDEGEAKKAILTILNAIKGCSTGLKVEAV